MKKGWVVFLAVILTALCASCGQPAEQAPDMEPELTQMKSICELAVMDCYYHNVAKYFEEDVSGILWWQKDKHFWIEYSGVVTLGVDVSQVSMEIDGDTVTVTMPEATVQKCRVDSDSLTEDSFIVAKDSAAVQAEDETRAFSEAQSQLEAAAAQDRTLLAEAQQRAKTLIEDYIGNIGSAVGKEYVVRWVDIGEDGRPLGDPAESIPEENVPTESGVDSPVPVKS